MIKKSTNGSLDIILPRKKHSQASLNLMKPQVLTKVCSYLTVVEIEELCLTDKIMRNKVYSISKIKIRILEAKVENTQKKLQVSMISKLESNFRRMCSSLQKIMTNILIG